MQYNALLQTTCWWQTWLGLPARSIKESCSSLLITAHPYIQSRNRLADHKAVILSVTMPPSPLEPGHKGKPWPEHFLVRTTGEVVPLIAVDELPAGIDLVGIPRSIGFEDTIGMLNLGLQRSKGSYYQIDSSQDMKIEHGSLNSKTK